MKALFTRRNFAIGSILLVLAGLVTFLLVFAPHRVRINYTLMLRHKLSRIIKASYGQSNKPQGVASHSITALIMDEAADYPPNFLSSK